MIIRKEAQRAKVDGELMAQFKARRLNMGVADTRERFLLDPGTWQSIESADAERIGPHYLAVDAGSNASMSCASGYWPSSGRLEVIGVFPENPPLLDRGHSDGVGELYVKAHERGELHFGGDRVADLQELMRLAWDAWGKPTKVICDTWREAELRQVLGAIKFPPTSIETRRQGWKDGSEDLRIFRNSCLDGKVHPVPSLLLRSAVGEARTQFDVSGNEKIVKFGGGRRRNARDDAAVSAVLAVAAGRRVADRPAPGPLSVAIAE